MEFRGRLTALALSSILAISGCHQHKNLEVFPPEKPLVTGVDGWGSNALRRFGDALEKRFGVPVEVVPVHYWENNLEEIRQAYREGRRIILAGYSAGCHQTAVLTAKECAKESIPIDLMILFDPTFTNDTVYYRPPNVKHAVFYFSSAGADIMGWARGNPANIVDGARKIEIKRKPGTHLDYINEENFAGDFERFIRDYTLQGRRRF